MSDYRQEAPFCVQIEPVQGCNLGCSFCGIHQIGYQQKMRGLDVMSLDTAESIAEQIAEAGWSPRIEFAMHGEPTMHPDLPALVGVFRRHVPSAYLMVTSNGGGLLKDTVDRVQALFKAGLNTLALDDYESNRIVERVLRNAADDVLALPDIHRYPQERKHSPHTRHRGQKIVVVQDIAAANEGTHSLLNNHAGSAGPLDYSLEGQRCAKVFRELSVRWDGNVAVCCNDWPGMFKVGNVLIEGLEAIWHHPRMYAARHALYHGERSALEPCNGCNARSYRVGLLPDKRGLIDLPMPTVAMRATLQEASAGEPYTSAVRPRGEVR